MKKENEELNRDKTELANSVTELKDKVTELEMQIEKMKCCYNCKHGRIYFVKEIIVDCLANKDNSNNKFNNCDKWELAE